MYKSDKQKTVVVIGGYGAVGSALCEELARSFSGRIVIAGRSYRRADLLARRLGERTEPAQLDASEPETYKDLLTRASLVINCVEGNNFAVAEQCLSKSVHYVDISAAADVINKLQTLDAAAKHAGATVACSVGVAPGLTNLLAHHAKARGGPLKSVDIFVLLGLGESHGGAAIQWTLKQLGETFLIKRDGNWIEVGALSERLSTEMPAPFGRRTAYRFNISDQHTLPETLRMENISTWLCFDSRAATNILRYISTLRLCSIFPIWRWSSSISKLSHWVAMGGTRFALQADAMGTDGHKRRFALVGDGEARTTGLVAARVAEHILQSAALPGTLHIEQLMNLEVILNTLGDQLTLTEQ